MGSPKGKSIWSMSGGLRHQWTQTLKSKERLFPCSDSSQYSAFPLDALGLPSWIIYALQEEKNKDLKSKGQRLRDSGGLCLGYRSDGNYKAWKI